MLKDNTTIFNKLKDLDDGRGIFELAQKHAYKLHEEFREEAFISTIQGIEKYMKHGDWVAIKSLLKMSFIAIDEGNPSILSVIMKNEEDFRFYCACIYNHMKACE